MDRANQLSASALAPIASCRELPPAIWRIENVVYSSDKAKLVVSYVAKY
jgi:hypothetical protein